MKNTILTCLLISFMFMAGCVGDQLIWKTANKKTGEKKELRISRLSGMAGEQIGKLTLVVIIKEPNSVFIGRFKVSDVNQTPSPESAEALGDMGANWISAGASGTAKDILKELFDVWFKERMAVIEPNINQ